MRIAWKVFLSDKSTFLYTKYLWAAAAGAIVGMLVYINSLATVPLWFDDVLWIALAMYGLFVTTFGTCLVAYWKLLRHRRAWQNFATSERQRRVIRQTFAGRLDAAQSASGFELMLSLLNVLLLVVARAHAAVVLWLLGHRLHHTHRTISARIRHLK